LIKDKKDICERIARFYKCLYDSNDIIEQQCHQHIQDKGLSIQQDETEKKVRELRKGKRGGVDGISSEIIKAGGKEMVQILTRLFNKCFEKKIIPKSWRTAEMCLIFKKEDDMDIGNYRPICLLSVFYKIFSNTY
jgi:hypothetical protein